MPDSRLGLTLGAVSLRGVPAVSSASAEDVRAMAALSLEAFAEYTRQPDHGVRRMLQRRGAQAIVVKRQGRVVGFAIVRPDADHTAWLDAIAVTRDERGRGLGRVLLEHAEGRAVALGARSLGLATADANLAALDLFMRAGYRIEARLPRHYERGQDAVLMKKRL